MSSKDSAPVVSIPEKANRLFKLVAERTREFGQRITLSEKDRPAVGARTPNELGFLLSSLHVQGLIEYHHPMSAAITMKGWEKLEPPAGGGIFAGRAFIAMSFDPTLLEAYTLGIQPAVTEDCKLPEPVRMDHVEHNDKICDRIIAEILKCEFMIADFTKFRSGVFFEAGFAKGLGRDVIWTCRQDHFKGLSKHFDTRQYSHIKWDTPFDLRQQLADRIQGSILTKRRA